MRACVVADPELVSLLQDEGEPHGAGRECAAPRGFLFCDYAPALPALAGVPGPPIDLYVLPAGLFLDLPADSRPFPVFAYGWAGLMAECFRQGASDYLRNPWSLEELEARALRFLRIRIRIGSSDLEFSGRVLSLAGARAELTESEYRIARILALNLNRPVPRDALAMALWGRPRTGSRAIDVHISSLRGKLDGLQPGAARFLTCSRREGYRLWGEYCG